MPEKHLHAFRCQGSLLGLQASDNTPTILTRHKLRFLGGPDKASTLKYSCPWGIIMAPRLCIWFSEVWGRAPTQTKLCEVCLPQAYRLCSCAAAPVFCCCQGRSRLRKASKDFWEVSVGLQSARKQTEFCESIEGLVLAYGMTAVASCQSFPGSPLKPAENQISLYFN